MTINEAQQEIVAEFELLPDWLDRYQQLIDMGQGLPPVEEKVRQECNLIKGCQSRVWIECQEQEGRLYFSVDSDAIITKGIAALLMRVFSGHTPEEILQADLFMIEQIGLKEHLTPNRANGLSSMLEHILAFAREKTSKV